MRENGVESNLLQLTVILFIGLSAASDARSGCPEDEYLIPFGCRCRSEGRVQCTGVQDAKKFEMILAACSGYELLVSRENFLPDFCSAKSFGLRV